MQKVTQILVTGGTHGNELTGVRTVEQWATLVGNLSTDDTSAEPLSFSTLIANPLAVQNRVRYVEEDLNRQFSLQALSENRTSIEAIRAKELNSEFGQSSNKQPDLVIDIHNTTSNMGTTLILIERNPFNQQLARYVHKQLPECNILLEDDQSYADHPYLCSLGKYGVMIEMGAQPQGVCRADVFVKSMTLLDTITQFVSHWNEQNLPQYGTAPVYQFIENISFPTGSDGIVNAMVHPNLQDSDFCICKPGQPVFIDFSDKALNWQGDEAIYPHFINEAAYQGTNVAFATARVIKW